MFFRIGGGNGALRVEAIAQAKAAKLRRDQTAVADLTHNAVPRGH